MADSKMQLFIKTDEKIIKLIVQPSNTVGEVKEIIERIVNIPWEEQQLNHENRPPLMSKIDRFIILLSFSMNMQTIQDGKAGLQVVHTSLLLQLFFEVDEISLLLLVDDTFVSFFLI